MTTEQNPKGPTPPAFLMQLATGSLFARALFCVTKLGIADLLGVGRQTAQELATRAGVDTHMLRRILRALCAVGIFDEDEADRFGLTSIGEPLRADSPRSVRQGVLFFGQDIVHRALGELMPALRAGDGLFRRAFGTDAFMYLDRDADAARMMHDGMEGETKAVAAAVVAAYDFSQFQTIVDVGGGTGALLAGILGAVTGARGVLAEVAAVLPTARDYLERAGVGARCTVGAIDMLEGVPAGGDVYILKSIIHDWNDDDAVVILRNCHRAMAREARLLLIERIVPEHLTASGRMQQFALADLLLLTVTNGRERTQAEYQTLLTTAGLRLQQAVLTRTPLSVMEAVPI